MNANELRIGNYVSVPTQPNHMQIICAIMPSNAGTSHTIEHITWGGYLTPYELIEPIYINDGWLLKFGFKFDKEFDCYNKGRITFSRVKGWKILENWITDWVDVSKLEYVHQLQNLYFALTGEELVCQ